MHRVAFALLGLAGSALGATPAAEPSDPPAVTASAPPVPAQAATRRGRHFAFLWDAEGEAPGVSDAQLWVNPRWGRVDAFTAVELRAGVLQGLARHFTLGAFVDATPSASGVDAAPGIDARLTLLGHVWGKVADQVGLAGQLAVSPGLESFAGQALLVVDAQLGAIRIGLNLDGWLERRWADGPKTKARFRQGLGLSYAVTSAFSAGIEMQNRLTWEVGDYQGLAFLIGPALSFRGEHFWVSVSLLPQVAAMKIESQRGVGDPLQLSDNERFSLRLSLGVAGL